MDARFMDDGSLLNDFSAKVINREVSASDIKMLTKLRPFLEIMHCDLQNNPVVLLEEPENNMLDSGSNGSPAILEIALNWRLSYWPGGPTWPSLFSGSPGNQVYYGNQPVFEEEEGFSVGTIQSQAVEVSVYMVLVAKQQQWQAIRINSATEDMKWAAWVAASYHDIAIFGFEPDEAAIERKNRAMPVLQELLDLHI